MRDRVLVNGERGDLVSVMDRGLSYGDGLFETVRLVGEVAPLWPRHMERLRAGCGRLGMPAPDPGLLWHEVLDVSRHMPASVVRVTLTRGSGERGYAPPASPSPTRILAAFAPPLPAVGLHADGLTMRVCALRLADQPRLAGMKHLNRLEQVLARAEWNDPAIGEGLLLDQHGHVVSATMANLFAVIEDTLLTPSLNRCGVAGVARAEVLASRPQTQRVDLTLETLFKASEVFLTSSVRGIVPVKSLDGRQYAPGATTRQLQQHWRNLGFSTEQEG